MKISHWATRLSLLEHLLGWVEHERQSAHPPSHRVQEHLGLHELLPLLRGVRAGGLQHHVREQQQLVEGGGEGELAAGDVELPLQVPDDLAGLLGQVLLAAHQAQAPQRRGGGVRGGHRHQRRHGRRVARHGGAVQEAVLVSAV